MERRAASHTEEEELNQRRRLLNLARKGDPKAISKLFELYQVRVYSGESLGKTSWPPAQPALHKKPASGAARPRAAAGRKRATKTGTQRAARSSGRAASPRRTAEQTASRRKVSHR